MFICRAKEKEEMLSTYTQRSSPEIASSPILISLNDEAIPIGIIQAQTVMQSFHIEGYSPIADSINFYKLEKAIKRELDKTNIAKSKDLEWYFFCPRERKYASGARMNRATETGYWKITRKDRSITYDEKIVASVKTLIFHQDHPPKGQRTDCVIHEYKFEDKELIFYI
ncbi:NAC domain-containing protein 82-like [Lycium barbarum]|uniref:NAC domain-containing protein 82-like n=1 Tax=Lycium barbarum TaxID=112863 RepID=UPI00293ED16E|nr:NAC domain-containing protein 82-like [Lycium barbarum]